MTIKKLFNIVLAFSIAFLLILSKDVTVMASEQERTSYTTEVAAYNAMIALKHSYPEGMPWNNSNYYKWNGGYFSGGYGCAGFAFMLSDAAFGTKKAQGGSDVVFSSVHVGDILRINNDSHSVIILEVHDDYVVVAEGNYNSSIHWGRTLSKAEVEAADYKMTRYVHTENKVSSCTETGYKRKSCYLCGEVFECNEVPVKDHIWDVGTITTKPTVLKEGVKTYTCSVCKIKKTEQIAKLKPTIKLSATRIVLMPEKKYTLTISKLAKEDSVKTVKSSKNSVATVREAKTNRYILTAKKKGTVMVTVTLESGKKAVCKITVK